MALGQSGAMLQSRSVAVDHEGGGGPDAQLSMSRQSKYPLTVMRVACYVQHNAPFSSAKPRNLFNQR